MSKLQLKAEHSSWICLISAPIKDRSQCYATFDLCLALQQWGFFSVPHLCDAEHAFKWSFARTRDTHGYCQAIRSEAVTNCFYDLNLEFELPTFRFQGERSILLRHRRSGNVWSNTHYTVYASIVRLVNTWRILAPINDQWVLVSLESRTSGLLFNYFLRCLCCSTSNTFFKIFDFLDEVYCFQCFTR